MPAVSRPLSGSAGQSSREPRLLRPVDVLGKKSSHTKFEDNSYPFLLLKIDGYKATHFRFPT